MFKKIKNWFVGNHENVVLEDKFSKIYEGNLFQGKESVSGPGSDLVQTAVISKAIPELIARHGITSLLDAPCGDFFWMRNVVLDCKYIGADIVKELVEKDQAEFGSETRSFVCADIVNGELPIADIIFCRDCLVHLTYEQALKAIANFKRSGAKYLLTTTFPKHRNQDLGSLLWRPLNLQEGPFNFPAPVELINENCTENNGRYSDKSLGFWKFSDIN